MFPVPGISFIKVIPFAPIIIITLLIATDGIIKEWKYGCGDLIRPVGHAGLFLGLIVAGIMGSKMGTLFSASVSFLLSVYLLHDKIKSFILKICSLWLLKDCYSFEAIILIISFLSLNIDYNTSYIDIFAHAGHISLYASCATSYDSMSFILACSISLFFLYVYSDIYSYIGIIISLFSFIIYHKTNKNNIFINTWIDRPLWVCKYGVIGSINFTIYSLTLLYTNFRDTCDSQYHTLYTIHIGGILAVCILIFPQVSPNIFYIFKIIISSAALSDTIFSGLRFFNFTNEFHLLVRSLFAFFSFISILLTNKYECNELLISYNFIEISYTSYIRITGVLFYIIVSFLQYIFSSSYLQELGQITHFCFIIGGISLEAIYWNDKLMTRISQLLVIFEIIGMVYDNEQLWYILKSSILLLSLPLYPKPIKNTLSF